MALVLTLAVLVLITAMVVEFAHGVYIKTESLKNWKSSTRLSLMARSGVSIATKVLSDNLKGRTYTYPGFIELPPTDPFADDGRADTVSVRIEDENSKFNLNTLLYENGTINEESYRGLRRLLAEIETDEAIADRVADWLDRDIVPRVPGSEAEFKNARMESTDELLLIPGIGPETYEKMQPYVTAFGDGRININGAGVPVLVALDERMTAEMAERIIAKREDQPFSTEGKLTAVAGFEDLGISLMGRITVKGGEFSVSSVAASEDGIRRVVRCVLDSEGNKKYWNEF
jgi:general secretion pathway protein K